MDAFDRELRDRLEALSDAVPVTVAPASGRRADVRSTAGRRGSPGLATYALMGLLVLAVTVSALLFLGGQISGILNTVGAPIGEPSPDSWIPPEQVGHAIDLTVLHLHRPASLEAVGILVLSGRSR
jgi:hypothetical protein